MLSDVVYYLAERNHGQGEKKETLEAAANGEEPLYAIRISQFPPCSSPARAYKSTSPIMTMKDFEELFPS